METSSNSFRQIRQSSLRQSIRNTTTMRGTVDTSLSRNVSANKRSISAKRTPSLGASIVDDSTALALESFKEGSVELTKNSNYCVSRMPATPAILKGSEEPCHGLTDQATSYAVVTGYQSAYVWHYSSADHIPNTLSFPISRALNEESPPLVSLISPVPGSREPGLIILVPETGKITFWEAVGGAVAAGLLHRKKSIEHQISLYMGEVIEMLQNIEPAGLVASTSSGRFILITLRDSSGKPAIASNSMRGTGTGLLSSIKGAISLAGSRRGIVSVKPGKITGRGERQILLINYSGDLSVWECSRSGYSRLLVDEKLREIMLNHISPLYPDAGNTLSIHDVEYFEEGSCLFILSSFVHNKTTDEIFYIIFTVTMDGNNLRIYSAHRIQTFTGTSTRQPRIEYPKPYKTLFIVFSNAVVLLDAMPNKSVGETTVARRWEDIITLRPEVEIIGSGQEDLMVVNGKTARHCGIIALTYKAGVLRIERYEEGQRQAKIQQLEPDLAKTKIEQAVFYGTDIHDSDVMGGYENNPLNFEARKEIQFDNKVLETAFLQVSNEILTTSSAYMPPILPSLAEHLALRVACLQRLAHYLRSNYPNKLSVSARRHLLSDLEKTVVAQALWAHIDMKLNEPSEDSRSKNVLVTVITQKIKSAVNKDPLREWFLQKALILDSLLLDCCIYCRKAVASNFKDVEILIDTNMVILEAVYNSTLGVRIDFAKPVYELGEKDVGDEPMWTSSSDLIKAIEGQYELTRNSLNKVVSKSDSAFGTLSGQLVCIVETLSTLYLERSNWMAVSDKAEAKNVLEVYQAKINGWLRQLVEYDQKEGAMKICQQFKVFRPLVEILVNDWRLNEESHNDEVRSQGYISQLKSFITGYGYEFASTLFNYLVEIKKLKALVVYFEEFSDHLDKFFASKDYGRISWAHEIRTGNFSTAGKTLAEVSLVNTEELVPNKKLQLSLAKLSLIAGNENVTKVEQIGNESLVKEVMAMMDTIDVQELLSSQIVTQNAADEQLKAKGYASLADILKRVVNKILQKKALTVEELVDGLTLVSTTSDESRLNFARALKLVYSDQRMSESRRSLNERIICTRLFVVDDWSNILRSTKQKSDAKVQSIMEKTILYQTIKAFMEDEGGLTNELSKYLNEPTLCTQDSISLVQLNERYYYSNENLLRSIANDMTKMQKEITILIKDLELTSWIKGISSRVQSSLGNSQKKSINDGIILPSPGSTRDTEPMEQDTEAHADDIDMSM